jgi:hypothetical protein
MKCPSCVGAKLVRDTRGIHYVDRGDTASVFKFIVRTALG